VVFVLYRGAAVLFGGSVLFLAARVLGAAAGA